MSIGKYVHVLHNKNCWYNIISIFKHLTLSVQNLLINAVLLVGDRLGRDVAALRCGSSIPLCNSVSFHSFLAIASPNKLGEKFDAPI